MGSQHAHGACAFLCIYGFQHVEKLVVILACSAGVRELFCSWTSIVVDIRSSAAECCWAISGQRATASDAGAVNKESMSTEVSLPLLPVASPWSPFQLPSPLKGHSPGAALPRASAWSAPPQPPPTTTVNRHGCVTLCYHAPRQQSLPWTRSCTRESSIIVLLPRWSRAQQVFAVCS